MREKSNKLCQKPLSDFIMLSLKMTSSSAKLHKWNLQVTFIRVYPHCKNIDVKEVKEAFWSENLYAF